MVDVELEDGDPEVVVREVSPEARSDGCVAAKSQRKQALTEQQDKAEDGSCLGK